MWHHQGSDTPTSARAIHQTDQKEPNILKGNVLMLQTFIGIQNSLPNLDEEHI